mmetsp:Transcript_34887/g.80676  ORF Transcript_34887/g.80676 Transcript_34887/m.80676 type:complete len:582 (-) Transcript_34887:1673-3418(-)
MCPESFYFRRHRYVRPRSIQCSTPFPSAILVTALLVNLLPSSVVGRAAPIAWIGSTVRPFPSSLKSAASSSYEPSENGASSNPRSVTHAIRRLCSGGGNREDHRAALALLRRADGASIHSYVALIAGLARSGEEPDERRRDAALALLTELECGERGRLPEFFLTDPSPAGDRAVSEMLEADFVAAGEGEVERTGGRRVPRPNSYAYTALLLHISVPAQAWSVLRRAIRHLRQEEQGTFHERRRRWGNRCLGRWGRSGGSRSSPGIDRVYVAAIYSCSKRCVEGSDGARDGCDMALRILRCMSPVLVNRTKSISEIPPLPPERLSMRGKIDENDNAGELEWPEVPVTKEAYVAAITCCARATRAQLALDLFQEMMGSGFSPTSAAYLSVLQACASVGKYVEAERIFDQMLTPTLNVTKAVPTIWHYNAFLGSYARAGRANVALEYLEAMAPLGDKKGEEVHNNFSSYDYDGEDPNVISMRQRNLAAAQASRLTPDLVTFNTVLSACVRAKEYQIAADLVKDMENGGPSIPKPDVITYNTLLSACEDPQVAFSLVQKNANTKQHCRRQTQHWPLPATYDYILQ